MRKIIIFVAILLGTVGVNAQTYCIPKGPTNTLYINGFSTTVGTANITNEGTGYSALGYGDFTSQKVTQVREGTINFTITNGNSKDYGYAIWVDWNKDGDFDDAGEKVYAPTSYQFIATGSIVVPATATVGQLRMRVACDYGAAPPPDPCSTTANGEFEDYTFEVTSASTPPNIALSSNNVAAANIAQASTNNPIYSFGIKATVASASLTGLKVTTTGTYASADIVNLKCYYQSSSTFNAGTATLLSTLTTPGTAGAKTFPSFTSQTIAKDATGYIFITADVACAAATTKTIAISAVTGTNTTFALGTATGTPAAGNTQTISALASVANVTGAAASVAASSSVISWTNVSCFDEVLIVAAAGSNSGTPTGNGSAYTANLAYASGTVLGNGYVVYKGSASTTGTVTGLTNGTSYCYKIFTRKGSIWSSGVEVCATPSVAYCASTSTSASSYFNSFSTTGGVSNITNSASGYSTNGYGDFTAKSASQVQGGTVSFNTSLTGTTVGVKIWVDWNQDGDFVDAGEEVYWSGSSYVSLATGSFTVPLTATLGNTRMRIRMDYNATAPAICGSITRGETEDYILTILASVTPTIVLSTNNVVAGNIAQASTNNPIYSFGISPTVASASLTGLTLTTTGSYASVDITNLKCYYQSSSTFNAGTATLLSTLTTPGTAGSKTFPSFTSQTIAKDATGYIFITADVACAATIGNTIVINAVTGTNTTFASGTVTGTPATGNTQTVSAIASVANVTGTAASVAGSSSVVSWTNVSCFDEVLIVAATGSNSGTPSGDGTAYTANLAYASGTALGNGFVVYKGTASPKTVTGLTNGTSYCYKIFTRKGTIWSSGVEVCSTPALSYCTTTYTGSTNDYIARVAIPTTTLDNTSNGATMYTLYPQSGNTTGTLTQGNTYTLTVKGTEGTGTGCYISAWIDYNNDGVFNSTNEFIGQSVECKNTTVDITTSWLIPVTSATGSIRMRLRSSYSSAPLSTQACGATTSAWGEAEDYILTIVASDPCITIPVLATTTSATSITTSSASSGGNVTSAGTGGCTVTARGVCWSTSTGPTTANIKTSDGDGTGSFTSSITGLSPNTTYYVRSYAINGKGTGYGAEISFKTAACTTPAIPATATATATGQETADLSWTAGSPAGSATVTYYWEVLEGATVRKSGSTTGTTASVTGLVCNTTYTFTVYAKTSCDNSQSSAKTSASFTTNACSACVTPGTPATATVSSPGLTSATLAWTAGTAGSATVTYYWAVGTANTVTYDAGYTSRGSTTNLTDAVSGLTCGTTYYLAVKATTSCDESSSGYKVSSSFSTLSCALDPCANATPLVCGVASAYVALANSGGVWDFYTGSGTQYSGTEKVWSFTPSVTGTHSFVTIDNSGDGNGTFFLMSSCNNTSTNLGGSAWDGSGWPTHNVTLTAGITYYLIADVGFGSVANVKATVTCPTTDINMSTGTTSVYCGTTYNFYDSGGPSGDYGNSQGYTYTFTSSNGNPLKMTFSAFTTAASDEIKIYNGIGTGGTVLLNAHSGSSIPSVITSTSSSLTVVFTSDGSTVAAGWAATVTCDVLEVVYGSPACGSAVAFCATNDNPGVNFGITSDISNAPAGQCSFMKNPTWWYLKISTAGDIDITIASSCGDVDFACYGPFSSTSCAVGDLTNSATSNYYPGAADAGNYNEAGGSSDSGTPFCREGTLKGTSGKLVDFGGSTSQVEYLQIRNTHADEYYMVLIGNFSHCSGTVSFEQTNLASGGSCDCSIVNLPVDLTDFDAECFGSGAKLYWQTATETNNDYFIIEKSNNGTEFYEIAKIHGAGNSNTLLEYDFVDENMSAGENYYRLKQVDYDGKLTVHKTIYLNCDAYAIGQTVMHAYPNPFKDELNVVIENIDEGDFTLEILDELARVVFSKEYKVENAIFTTTINLEDLKASVYTLRSKSNDNVLNVRIVKQ